MIVKFDFDGVICNETSWDSTNEAKCYQERTPNDRTIALMHRLVDEGHVVIIETARRERWRTLTEQWLESHGVPYHYLFMAKIICDYVIDDLARSAEDIERLLEDGNGRERHTRTL